MLERVVLVGAAVILLLEVELELDLVGVAIVLPLEVALELDLVVLVACLTVVVVVVVTALELLFKVELEELALVLKEVAALLDETGLEVDDVNFPGNDEKLMGLVVAEDVEVEVPLIVELPKTIELAGVLVWIVTLELVMRGLVVLVAAPVELDFVEVENAKSVVEEVIDERGGILDDVAGEVEGDDDLGEGLGVLLEVVKLPTSDLEDDGIEVEESPGELVVDFDNRGGPPVEDALRLVEPNALR